MLCLHRRRWDMFLRARTHTRSSLSFISARSIETTSLLPSNWKQCNTARAAQQYAVHAQHAEIWMQGCGYRLALYYRILRGSVYMLLVTRACIHGTCIQAYTHTRIHMIYFGGVAVLLTCSLTLLLDLSFMAICSIFCGSICAGGFTGFCLPSDLVVV